jgi:hypothetical protein
MGVGRRIPGLFRAGCGRGSLALACVLLVGGCSAGDSAGARKSSTAAHHDAGVRLSPDPAYSTARIAVILEDPRLQQANCKFLWRRNGVLVVGAETNGLDPSHVSKGDEIAVVVTVRDPATGKVQTLNASVHVENTPPKLTRVTVMPDTSADASSLRASVECADLDGDVATFDYHWFRNGEPVDGASGATLPLSSLKRGDRVVVEVVAHDDVSASVPMRSDPYAFNNQPPRFTSQPKAPRADDKTFQYQAVAVDLDGDPIGYELVSGPDGMTVDSGGNVSWLLPTGELRRGTYPVRIRAKDARGGEATQDFTISLDPPAAK